MHIDYWALSSALAGVLAIAIMIWVVVYLDSVLGIPATLLARANEVIQ